VPSFAVATSYAVTSCAVTSYAVMNCGEGLRSDEW